MSKKKYDRPEDRGKPAGIQDTTPQPKTEILHIENQDPAFNVPDVDLDDRDAGQAEETEETEERSPRKIITWGGQAHNHKCPLCGCTLCDDRRTKACAVIRTKNPEMNEKRNLRFVDREMLCRVCRNDFICREWENKSE